MRRFLTSILRAVFGAPPERESSAGGARPEAQVLREKIEKWESQADEYEAMGLTESARRSRESLVWYRRKLMVLENPSIRRAA